MGRLLRRYWVPALLSEELPTPDCLPVRVRLLSENLIAFRDSAGQVGLLDEFCSHRGASLYFGRSEGGALRCPYHGWAYNSRGDCVDMPNEPPSSTFKEKVHHLAYPCVERNGLVWTYLGPREKQPPLPELEYMLVPQEQMFISKRLQECHWTQCMDGDMDATHVPFLHRAVLAALGPGSAPGGEQWTRTVQAEMSARMEIVKTPYGQMNISAKRLDEDSYCWRIGHWAMPWYTFVAAFSGDGPVAGHAWVPIDDEHTWAYGFVWHPTRPLSLDNRADRTLMHGPFSFTSDCAPGTYLPIHNKRNDYVEPDWPFANSRIDRMRAFQDQDVACTESMGPLFDRTREHLGTADQSVIQQRARLVQAARALQKGVEPPAMNPADYRIRQFAINLPSAVTCWKEARAAVGDHIKAYPETFVASA
jgi:phenylpropionate dioxygenase-like ring-hydroxylating dioxygenase large terminal subunit